METTTSLRPPSSSSASASAIAISIYRPLSLHLRLQSNFIPPTPLNLKSKPLSSLHFKINAPSDSRSSLAKSPYSNPANGAALLFPSGGSKHWIVRIDRPGTGVARKPQIVDFCVETLTKVLGNEKDAQMCIYHVSWHSNFGFCCELDDESARELAGVSGVLSVHPDYNFGSTTKDYRGAASLNSTKLDDGEANQINPKKLFITGLSFYTSEKTLREAFEPFGELVLVNVIMDKISKRSKGYAFVEYTTKEAASAALREMNGKIINGWMIVVDMAKNKPRYGRRPA